MGTMLGDTGDKMAHRNRKRRRNTRRETNQRLRFTSSIYSGVSYVPSFRSSWSSFTPVRFKPTTLVPGVVSLSQRNDWPSARKMALKRPTYTNFQVQQSIPKAKVISLCDRRSQRREIMFASNKAGQGGQRRAVWTPDSKRRCK